jgi:hypothetical protein
MELNAMTMAQLISRRVAKGARNLSWLSWRLNGRVSRRIGAGVEAATALEGWEAEGGASPGVRQASERDASRPSALEPRLLKPGPV